MSAAATQKRALLSIMGRTHGAALATRGRVAQLAAALHTLRSTLHERLDEVLFDLTAIEADLAALAVDTALIAPADRKARRAAAPAPESHVEAKVEAPAPPPARRIDLKRRAANDRDDLPLLRAS